MVAIRWMEEVVREADRCRSSGGLPEALERGVDSALDRFAPTSAARSQAGDLLAATRRASRIDAAVPLPARRSGGVSSGLGEAVARRLVRKAMSFYVSYVAHQAGRFTSAEVGLLASLEQRLSVLEVRAGADPAWVAPRDLDQWSSQVVELLGGLQGRILHAECGDGQLLSALVGAGLDAYGVDPAHEPPDLAGLDVWSDEVFAHLGAVGDRALAALVLSGCVERVSPTQARRLVALARDKLAPGAQLVLIARNPGITGNAEAVPILELAGGRSLHPETWRHLLSLAGFQAPVARMAADSFAVTAQAPR